MGNFSGFGPETIKFLAALGKNNTKAWFDENRAAYDAHYVTPARDIIEAVAGPLRKIAPDICAEPRINGSIFRVNRDIRFSADKTPYKDHIDIWFWEGPRKGAVSGFFLRLTATDLIVGAGAHRFDREKLASWRNAVVAPETGNQIQKIIEALEKKGHSASGMHYSKLPRGFAPNNPAQEALLRHNALWVSREQPHPAGTGSAALVDYCMDYWTDVAPLHRWLTDTLSA
ncbi:unnamed protein product [marine sediment metagenome]|uniref:TIGR02453 family protein n=1 Tax=marine sediment metagenome TaxID=412755 RepID=X0T3L7_9ZZZZ